MGRSKAFERNSSFSFKRRKEDFSEQQEIDKPPKKKSKFNNFVNPSPSRDSWLINSDHYFNIIEHILTKWFDDEKKLEILIPGAGMDPSTFLLVDSFKLHKFVIVDPSKESELYFKAQGRKNIIFHKDWSAIKDEKFDLILDKSFTDVLIVNHKTKDISDKLHNKLNDGGVCVILSMKNEPLKKILNLENEYKSIKRYFGVMFGNNQYTFQTEHKRERKALGIVSIGILHKVDKINQPLIDNLNKFIIDYFNSLGMKAFEQVQYGTDQTISMKIKSLDQSSTCDLQTLSNLRGRYKPIKSNKIISIKIKQPKPIKIN